MKLFVIDFETTGLDVETLQPLSFSILALDTNKGELPKLEDVKTVYFKWDVLHFKREDMTALFMNERLLSKIYQGDFILDNEFIINMPEDTDKFVEMVKNYILLHDPDSFKIVVAGKNAGSFDVPILKRFVPGMRTSNRIVDPTVYFTDFASDIYPIDMNTLLIRLKNLGYKVDLGRLHDSEYDVFITALAVYIMAKKDKPE